MMKKILITSDTHRRDGNLLEVIQNEAPFDMFIHLGDAEGSEAEPGLRGLYGAGK